MPTAVDDLWFALHATFAGAYAIQGCGAFLVERIDGSPSNVIGLPACEVVLELDRAQLLEGFPSARVQ